jgi:hypothetical protein
MEGDEISEYDSDELSYVLSSDEDSDTYYLPAQTAEYTPFQKYIVDLVDFLGNVMQNQLNEWVELRQVNYTDDLAHAYIMDIIYEDITVEHFDYLIESVFLETFDQDFESTFALLLKKFKSWITVGYLMHSGENNPEFNDLLGADTREAFDLLTRADEKGIPGLDAADGVTFPDETPFALRQSAEEYREALVNAYNVDLNSGWISVEDAEAGIQSEMRGRKQDMTEWIISEKLKMEYKFIEHLFKYAGKEVPELINVAEDEPSTGLYIADIGVPENCMLSDFMGESPVGDINEYTDVVLIYTGTGSFDQAICWKLNELEKLMNDPTNIYYECEGDYPPNIDNRGTGYVGSTAPAGNSTFIKLPDYKLMLQTARDGETIFYIVPMMDSDGKHRTPRAVSLAYLINLPGAAVSGKHCEPQDTMSLYEVRQFVKDAGEIDMNIEEAVAELLDRFKAGTILEGLEGGEITDKEKNRLVVAAKWYLSYMIEDLQSMYITNQRNVWNGDIDIRDLLEQLDYFRRSIETDEMVSDLQEMIETDTLTQKLETMTEEMDVLITQIYNQLVIFLTELTDGHYPHEDIPELSKLVDTFDSVSANTNHNREIKRLIDADKALSNVFDIRLRIVSLMDKSSDVKPILDTLQVAMALVETIAEQGKAKGLLEESISSLQEMSVHALRVCIRLRKHDCDDFVARYIEISGDEERGAELLALSGEMNKSIENVRSGALPLTRPQVQSSSATPDWRQISSLSKNLGISNLTDQLHMNYDTHNLEGFEELKEKLDNAHDALGHSQQVRDLFGLLQPIIDSIESL